MLDCAARATPYWSAYWAPYCVVVRGYELTPEAAATAEALLRAQGDRLVARVVDPAFCHLSPTDPSCPTPDQVVLARLLAWAVPAGMDSSWSVFAVRDAALAQATAPPGEARPQPVCAPAMDRLGALAGREAPAGSEAAAWILAYYLAPPQPSAALRDGAETTRPAWGLVALLLPCSGHDLPTPGTSAFVLRELVGLLAPEAACWLWQDTWCAPVDPRPLAEQAAAGTLAGKDAILARASAEARTVTTAAAETSARLNAWAATMLDLPVVCSDPAACAGATLLVASDRAVRDLEECGCHEPRLVPLTTSLVASMRDGLFQLGQRSQRAAEAVDGAVADERAPEALGPLAGHSTWVVFVFLPAVDEGTDLYLRATLTP